MQIRTRPGYLLRAMNRFTQVDVVDDGSCKHCTASIFAVASFCERHKDCHTQVGTDIPCVWDNFLSLVSSHLVLANYIKLQDYTGEEPEVSAHHSINNPCKSLNNNPIKEIEEKKLFQLLCFYTKCGFFCEQIHYDPLKFEEIVQKCEYLFDKHLKVAIMSL
ncbi:uncharacterized protein LOC133186089 [Saccostrea echinata]|uniref:uncharacterized protein LOC133186089 n=1 Tax=Saccostrea echinata TaxID=191078 RepID=UPI002A83DCEF|nr:uncharacterized protein LOC133186089 [Saccostrea echinata]